MRFEMMVWAIVALLLFAAETLAPGAFMLWIGIAASAMLVLVWLVPGIALHWQATIFIALSFVSIMAYRKWWRGRERQSDQPLLNQKSRQLIGQVYPLDQAIENGRGRVKIGDAFWIVHGPDLPKGASVRVVNTDGTSLEVREVG